MFEANHVVVSCSKSEELSSTHSSFWFEYVVLPHVPSKFLLLSDLRNRQRTDSV